MAPKPKPIVAPLATLEEFRAEMRGGTREAIDALRSALGAKAAAIKLQAAKTWLEFTWGKPAQSVQHSFDGPVRHKVFHLTLTDELGIGDGEEDPEGGTPA